MWLYGGAGCIGFTASVLSSHWTGVTPLSGPLQFLVWGTYIFINTAVIAAAFAYTINFKHPGVLDITNVKAPSWLTAAATMFFVVVVAALFTLANFTTGVLLAFLFSICYFMLIVINGLVKLTKATPTYWLRGVENIVLLVEVFLAEILVTSGYLLLAALIT